MSGPRPRHPDDDERLLDLDGLDFRVPLEEFGQRQPIAQQADHTLPQRGAGELGQTLVGFDRGDMRGQPVAESVGIVEVADAGLLDRLGDHLVDAEVDGPGLGVVQNLPLDVGELGRRQIVEVDVSDVAAHRSSSTKCRMQSSAHRRSVWPHCAGVRRGDAVGQRAPISATTPHCGGTPCPR
jgi:hypothetical protein